jgi:hypothetical protein
MFLRSARGDTTVVFHLFFTDGSSTYAQSFLGQLYTRTYLPFYMDKRFFLDIMLFYISIAPVCTCCIAGLVLGNGDDNKYYCLCLCLICFFPKTKSARGKGLRQIYICREVRGGGGGERRTPLRFNEPKKTSIFPSTIH